MLPIYRLTFINSGLYFHSFKKVKKKKKTKKKLMSYKNKMYKAVHHKVR